VGYITATNDGLPENPESVAPHLLKPLLLRPNDLIAHVHSANLVHGIQASRKLVEYSIRLLV
jgi:hypothetical protein